MLIACLITISAIGSLYTISWAKNKHTTKVNYRADKLEGGEKENGQEPYKQLIGHVVFTHEAFTIYADSAQYYDKKGLVKASGHLRMVDQEGGVMLAEQVIYDVNTRLALLRDSVSYQRDTLSFYTDELDYAVKDKKGYFRKGGRLVQNNDQLSSEAGSYDDRNKLAYFYHQVKFTNQEYCLQCDTLCYHVNTKLSEFKGNTKIVTKDSATISTDVGGEYNTDTKNALFRKARIETEKYSMYGNLIEADLDQNYYAVSGQVKLTSKEHQATITGMHSYYAHAKGIAEVYGNPLLERIMDGDTLYMVADTLKAIEDKQAQDTKDHVILAYNNVKIYQSNLQGKADSMAYHSLDSTVYFYNKPVFWNYDNQITAESVSIVLNNESLEKMSMNIDAFIASEDTLGNYNQVKGREMVAQFQNNKMQYIDILGNGESLYFAIGDSLALIGMNYIRCSHIRVDMEDQELAKISFFVQPTGTFYPAHKILAADKQLLNFTWQIRERPKIEEFLLRKHSSQINYTELQPYAKKLPKELILDH